MEGGVLERGECEVHDRPKFGIHWYVRLFFVSNLPLQPLKKTHFALSLHLGFFARFFWGGGVWGIEGTAVQCLSMLERIRVDLCLLARLHVSAISHFEIFPFFRPPDAGSL